MRTHCGSGCLAGGGGGQGGGGVYTPLSTLLGYISIRHTPYTQMHAGIHNPPVDRMTDACENSTFASP